MRSPRFCVASIFVAVVCATNLLYGQLPQASTAKLDVYVVPFSHLDLFWAGTREECLARGNKVIARAIEIAEQHPEFKFFIESDNFLANFVESHEGSRELSELKQLIKEGRIGIAPNWADIFLNLSDGEVLARNFLYGKLYARGLFGVDPLVNQPSDIPGFPSQYPQILREAGIPYMEMSRMGPEDRSLFDWSAPDGSSVEVWNQVRGYAWGVHLHLQSDMTEADLETLHKELNEVHQTAPGPIELPWGLDLWTPTPKLVENVDRLNQTFPYARFTFATPQDFFKAAGEAPNLPDLKGEIPLGWPHVVDGILHLWQLAPPATSTLTEAEEFSAINYALGYADYPQKDLELLWKKLIESMDHNHDGQGGKIGDDRKMEDSKLVMMRGGEILRNMLTNIAERVRIPIAGSVPIVVFNGLGFQREGLVRAHVTLFGDVAPADIKGFKEGIRLVDETGTAVPFAVEETSENISRAVQLIFVAQGVPSLGYKTYFLTPAAKPESLPPASQVTLDRDRDQKEPRRPLGSDVMENRFYRVTVDKATGGVTVFDKQLNRDVTKDMEIVGVEERGSNNVQPELDTGRTFPMAVSETSLEENNPVRTVLKISGYLSDIPISQRLILYRDLKRLDIEDRVDWKSERLMRVEQLFPVEQPNAEMVYGVPFGANTLHNVLPGSGPRANDEINTSAWEHYRVIQGWVFAGTPDWGVTVSADHQLVSFDSGLIRANMIRGQRYTSAKIVRGEEVTSIHYPPKGRYAFRYSLSSGAGDWKSQRSYESGLSFNSPLLPTEVVDDVSAKSLPPSQSFCSVQGDDLVISALKKAESSKSIILRLYEIHGAVSETPVTFLGKTVPFRETNLLEQAEQDQVTRTLRVRPYQIQTIELQPEPRRLP